MKRLLLALFLFSLGRSEAGAASASELAQATVVVYNRAAPESAELARFYARARQIPTDQVIGLDCSTEEEISRQEYDEAIANPLRKIFAERNWWSLSEAAGGAPVASRCSIHFVALIRGMPLKIRSTAEYPGDKPQANQVLSQNNASVDSELTLLGYFNRQISGPGNNPYYESYLPVTQLRELPLLLVARLDGPSAAIVRQMITDAVATEKTGLWGRAYVDAANNTSGGLADGDEWLRTVVKNLRQAGIPTVYDSASELFPAGYPMTDCALYYGWYAEGASGPFTDPDFSFRPGAVAVHLHSFSANSLRSPAANWVAPLLSKGAAASLGNVYEPYLQLTAHLDIFNDRLLHGFTFAESAWMAQRVVSWMTVAVGDPLYRPYAAWLQLEPGRTERGKGPWQMYHEFAVKNARQGSAESLSAACKAASRAENGPMLEDLGLMAKERGDFSAAESDLEQARSLYREPEDRLRTVLEEADMLLRAGKKKAALALVRKAARVAPEKRLLRQLELQIDPPPPTPPPLPNENKKW